MEKMTKIKFLLSLHDKLSALPQDEVEERLNFYSEMIEDRMEEGLSEEDAVAAIGSVDEIAEQIAGEIPLPKIAIEKIKPKRKLRAWEIVLLALGSPIWLSLLVAALSIVVSAYAVIWAGIISLWAVFGALAGCAVGGAFAGAFFIATESGLVGVAVIGAGLVCGGLSIFMFFGCMAATEGVVLLTKKAFLGLKKCFIKREEA